MRASLSAVGRRAAVRTRWPTQGVILGGATSGGAILPRSAVAPRAPVWQAATCCFSEGGGYKQPEPEQSQSLPDSWVEPDALWDYAEAHMGEPADQAFEAEFGKRNQRWRKRMLKESPELFESIGAGQAPKYFWIGCCDSRVAAETMIEAKPGEIFVHRNIANMVVSTDTNLRAALKFAVEYLRVQHIIVCGHYDCGGLKAAASKNDHSAPLENWLTNIRDVVRLHQEELEAIVIPEERHKRLVELNIIEQCLNLFKTGDVQRRRAETGSRPDQYECAYPRIHGMVFDPRDGILRKLPIDFKYYLKKYKNVYQMYDAADFQSDAGAGA